MPFRRWFAARGARHPTVYSMVTLAAAVFASMAIVVAVNVQLNQQALARERATQHQTYLREQAQRAESHRAVCTVVNSMRDVYSDPPSTPTGQKAKAAWADLSTIFNCE